MLDALVYYAYYQSLRPLFISVVGLLLKMYRCVVSGKYDREFEVSYYKKEAIAELQVVLH